MPLFPDLLEAEYGIIRYLLDALEVTEFVRLCADAGLFKSPRCGRASVPFGSNSVRLALYPSGVSCTPREDAARARASSNAVREPIGICCTFATMVCPSMSYCCTV